MEVNMKVLVVTTTWVWIVMVGATWDTNTCPAEPSIEGCSVIAVLRYIVVNFTTVDATRESYTDFMQALRGHLTSGHDSHGIPVMRVPSAVPDSERFLLVGLSNWEGLSIMLAIDVTNAYLVAYRAGGQSYFFSDAPDPAFSSLFPETRRQRLPFTGSYMDLERVAHSSRGEIELGMSALGVAITNIYRFKMGNTQRSLATSLLIVIQMVSEAARFRYIERIVGQSIEGRFSFFPNAAMLSLENNWGALSTAIQGSSQGVFYRPVQLRRPNNTVVNVDSVTERLIPNLGLLLFVCTSAPSSRFKRSVDGDYNDNICVDQEPTIRISGRNGLCVDVKGGVYDDGNPIILWQCTTELNQLWTLKKDGTIQSDGKCLTIDYCLTCVTIYNCDEAETIGANIRWEVQEDGSIIDPHTKLALSTYSGNAGSKLTMTTNEYTSSQGWLASNNTTPFDTLIMGFKDLCLIQGNRFIWLAECDSDQIEQKWSIYADGSVRPQQDQDMCLTCNGNEQGSTILILRCIGSSEQRWMFKNDGTILNLHNGLVMDVKRSDPSLKEIIIWPSTGNLNQKWLPLL